MDFLTTDSGLQPEAFIPHAASLGRFVHCRRFSTAATRGVWAVSQSQ